MSNLRQAAQQALEALEILDGVMRRSQRTDAAVAALRAALAEPRPIQECYGDCPTDPATCPNPCRFEGRPKPEQEPVAWVELTDEEQLELARDSMGRSRHWLVAQVEAKLKEKNT